MNINYSYNQYCRYIFYHSRLQPTTCANPVCNNVADICPGKMVCEPTTAPAALLIGAICNYIFTIEYGIRFFSLWAVDSRFATILTVVAGHVVLIYSALCYFRRLQGC